MDSAPGAVGTIFSGETSASVSTGASETVATPAAGAVLLLLNQAIFLSRVVVVVGRGIRAAARQNLRWGSVCTRDLMAIAKTHISVFVAFAIINTTDYLTITTAQLASRMYIYVLANTIIKKC